VKRAGRPFDSSRRRRWWSGALPLLMAATVACSGCSLVYARGPQTSASPSPPEPCTSTNVHAIADTVLASVFFTALVGGTIALIDGTQKHGGWNGFGEDLIGLGLIGTGFVGTAIFTPSAVVGYNRAAACRAWEAMPSPLPPPRSTNGTTQGSFLELGDRLRPSLRAPLYSPSGSRGSEGARNPE